MKTNSIMACALGALAFMAAGAASAADDEVGNSGFLGDDAVYAKLEKIKTRGGKEGHRWVGPSLNAANYNSVLVDDVVLYPAPEPSAQVSEETLKKISSYLTEELKEKVGAVVSMAEAPGTQVLQIQAAVTGVEIKTEGMKAYEVIPVAAIFSAAKAAAGKRKRDVYVRVEVRLVDSTSGELVGAATRRIEGKELKGKKDQLGLQDMQESLDQATDDAADEMTELLSP